MTRQALVEFAPGLISAQEITAEIERLGYLPRLAEAPSAEQLRRSQRKALLWRTGIAWLAMMQIMMYAWPAYQSAPGELLPDHAFLLRWAQWILSLPVVLIAASPILRSAWSGLKMHTLNMDVTVSAAIALTFVFSTHATFSGHGEVWFDSLSMFVALILSVRYLLMRGQHVQEARIERLAAAATGSARRILQDRADSSSEARTEDVDVDSLRVGDLVLVPAGGLVPADGQIVRGTSALNEAILTGESMPIARRVGERVHAGTINLSAELHVRIDAIGTATRAAEIAQIMRRVAATRFTSADRADRWAPYFLMGVLASAALGAAFWLPQDPDRALSVAIAVLMVTCPCALSLATPAAMFAAVSRLGELGVYLRRPAVISRLARISTVIFDKTGTLSADALCVERVYLTPDRTFSERDVLHMATALEGQGFHPVAAALRLRVGQSAKLPTVIRQREQAGVGVEGWIDGQWYRFGKPSRSDILPGGGLHCELIDAAGRIALVEFSERVREEAGPAVQALARQGFDLLVLSGDSPIQAARLAQSLQIYGVRGGLTADDKLAHMQSLQRQGRVVLAVGDGLNDGPLLAGADVSAALVTGAPATQAAADLVILGGRLTSLAALRAVASKALAVVNQNLTWALAYNLICVPLAIAGWISPGWASVGMAVSSLVVLANAARVARSGREAIKTLQD